MDYERRTAKVAWYAPTVMGGKKGAPISLQVALTDACFNRCMGCGHPTRVQHKMEVDRWLRFLDGADLQPVESVCYSGGDPMAYPDFNEVMAFHVSRSMAFGMTITGYVPPTIDINLMAQAEWVRVSLDAVTPEVYNKVRGKTPVTKVFAGIDKMLAAGANVELGITLSPDNESDLDNILTYAEGKGIKTVDARYAYPQSNPKWPDLQLETRGVKQFNNCHAALYQLYIDSDGSVYPCCVTAGDTRGEPQAMALGNIWDNHWAVIWENTVEYSRKDIADLPDICRNCCVQRLSEINHVCGKIAAGDFKPGKSFF